MARPSVREDILEAALEQFHLLGFNGCSVEDITDAAEVPKGSFYNHFKGKEDLAIQVLDRYVATRPLALLRQEDVPPLKRLRKYFSALTEEFLANKCRSGCLLGNFASELADHSPSVRSKLAMLFSGWTGLLSGVIREAQEAREVLTHQRPELLAGFLLSAWEGTLVRARAANDPAIVKEFHTIAFSQLLA